MDEHGEDWPDPTKPFPYLGFTPPCLCGHDNYIVCMAEVDVVAATTLLVEVLPPHP